MFQQLIALIFILFFLSRLFWQRRKNQIEKSEFSFWVFFWALAGVSIVFIKKIDSFVAGLGFSSSGIDVLFYIGVVFLFYLVFRIRIRQERLDKDITKIVREIALEVRSRRGEK